MPTTRRGGLRGLMAAVYPLLNVSTLTTVSTGGVFQGIAPQGTAKPYTVIEAPRSEKWNAMQQSGEDDRFYVRAVSERGDYGEALSIIAVVIQLLDGERPSITNHLTVSLSWEDTRVFPDPEMVNGVPVFHALAEFRSLVDQVS